jgi:hypothetical protein
MTNVMYLIVRRDLIDQLKWTVGAVVTQVGNSYLLAVFLRRQLMQQQLLSGYIEMIQR